MEAARAGSWHEGSALRRRGEPDAGGKRTAVAAQGIGSDGGIHLSQIQIASGQDPHPGKMSSALSRAEVISRPDTQFVSCPFQIAINIDLR
jgi:hypothetical protein